MAAWQALGSGSLAETVGCAVPILTAGFIILYLYNGQRTGGGRSFSKWFFYTFYPAHLLVLGLIRILSEILPYALPHTAFCSVLFGVLFRFSGPACNLPAKQL